MLLQYPYLVMTFKIALIILLLDISHHNFHLNQNLCIAPNTTDLMSVPMASRRQSSYLVSLGRYTPPHYVPK